MNRRDFLKRAGAAAATVSAVGQVERFLVGSLGPPSGICFDIENKTLPIDDSTIREAMWVVKEYGLTVKIKNNKILPEVMAS